MIASDRRSNIQSARMYGIDQPRTIVGAIVVAVAVVFIVGGLSAALRVQAARPSCNIVGVERIVAVGDVHGAYDRFVEILQTAGILDSRLRWSGGKTHLVQLGDVVDRGPDSRKALDLLNRLRDDAEHAGGAVHQLLGNQEVMRMLGDLRFVSSGEYQAFATPQAEITRARFVAEAKADARDQLMKSTPLGFVEMRVAFGRQGEYGHWLRKLDVVVKINGVIFLHGGISPAVAPLSCDAINKTAQAELGGDLDKTRAAPLSSLVAREDGPLWYRGLAQQPDTFAPQVDEILSTQNAKTMVIAHTVVPAGRILTRFGGKVIQIDTGMQPAYVPTGQASALEIRNGVFTAIYQDRREVLLGAPTETPKVDRHEVGAGGRPN